MFVPFHVAASIATRVVLSETSLVAPPMMPPMPGRAVRVADQHGVAVEHALLAVERREPLALARRAHVQLRARDPVEVVGVHRLAERQHHVVGDVDHVADRPLAGRHQARLQPQRRRAHLHVGEDAHAEPRAKVEVFDLDRNQVGGVRRLPPSRAPRPVLPGQAPAVLP